MKWLTDDEIQAMYRRLNLPRDCFIHRSGKIYCIGGSKRWCHVCHGPRQPPTPALKVGTPAQAESPGDEVQKGKP